VEPCANPWHLVEIQYIHSARVWLIYACHIAQNSGSKAVKKSSKSFNKRNRIVRAAKPRAGNKILLPALIAAGGGLTALPVAALELGEVTVHSSLGQPLAASIAVALAPNEDLLTSCVSLQRASTAGGMPVVDSATIRIANGVISLTGKTAIREPMLTMRVNINCPYTPNLSREYMLFVDPPGLVATPAEGSTVTSNSIPVSTQPVPTSTRRPAARPDTHTPVENGARYQVQPGDTLSTIAQDIDNQQVGLWNAVMAIFDANPNAFMDNDPNRLKAGSWLNIPDFGAASSAVASDNATVAEFASSSTGAASIVDAGIIDVGTAYPGVDETQSTAAGDNAIAAVVDAESVEANAPFSNLQPGDIILDADNPYVTPAGSSAVETVILDTPLESPTVASSPNGSTMTIQTAGNEANSSNWLVWLAGSGVAIIIALLLFGRRIRNRFGSAPIGAVAKRPERHQTESGAETQDVLKDHDYGLADDSPTEENLVLDADLIAGTGLEQSTDMHVAQDFGFAATTYLDMELSEEMSSGVPSSETDIIPPLTMDLDSILESEVLPSEDDYDMSVVVDATKMPRPEDVTERDLKAVPVVIMDDTLIGDDYTVNKEVDFDVLEQDYEDEMSATQALNQEIAKAALELAEQMDEPGSYSDASREMPLATVTDIDVTAQLPIEVGNAGDADVTSMLPEQAAEFAVDDKAVEMPANDADVTAEIPVDADNVDSKAS
jgi:FimV-like protein